MTDMRCYEDFLAELQAVCAEMGDLPAPPAPPRRKFADIVAEIRNRMCERGLDGYDYAETVATALVKPASRGIWLAGNTGSGKTERALFAKGILACRFYTAQDIVDLYGKETAWQQLFQRWNTEKETENDIFVDDLGTESPCVNIFGKVVDPMSLFIQGRYAKHLRVHYTTNLNASDVVKRYGERVHSRLLETVTVFPLLHPDRRKTKN